MTRLGPYSRPAALRKLDGRTREAKLLHRTRAELTAHVGGSPSATQRALIERAVSLTLQIAMLDAKHATGGFTAHDAREYLAWTNALTRLMRHLGQKGVAERALTPREVLSQRAGSAA